MGFLKNFKKEVLINRLVRSYRHMYNCGDMEAINILRGNYSYEELKNIYDRSKQILDANGDDIYGLPNFFKE